jgi:hypothetical protein
MTVREATVGPESGTTFVDGTAKSTRSTPTPSPSAAIWRKTVSTPCPISVEAVRTRARPPGRRSTATFPFRYFSPEPVKPAPWRKTEAPTPRAVRPETTGPRARLPA